MLIFRKKSIVPPENDEEQPSEDPMIFCFVCGHLRPSKTLIEHIDKCYRRIEAETSLTSIFETKVEGSKRLFCDAYNNNTKAFCKRLKVNPSLKFFITTVVAIKIAFSNHVSDHQIQNPNQS